MGRGTDVTVKTPLMVAISDPRNTKPEKLRWKYAEVLINSSSETINISNERITWIIRLENIASIDKIENEVGEFLKVTLKSGRYSLFFYGPTPVLLRINNLLTKLLATEVYHIKDVEELGGHGGISHELSKTGSR